MQPQLSSAKQSLGAILGAIRRMDGSGCRNGMLYKGLVLLFALVLSLSMAAWLKSRQELQAVTAANGSLRKTLGDLTIAIAEKDREIDRLTQSDCEVQKKPQVGRRSVPRRGDRL